MDPRLFTPTPFVPEIRLANEARELTVLFADIRGFSRIAERLDSQALHAYVNRFLTAMTEVVLRFQGTIDKYIGDSVMAYWGAPLFDPEHEDHSRRYSFLNFLIGFFFFSQWHDMIDIYRIHRTIRHKQHAQCASPQIIAHAECGKSRQGTTEAPTCARTFLTNCGPIPHKYATRWARRPPC
jgi:class 3 adenylate cyclase